MSANTPLHPLITPNDDEVICPACCHQFRAIPATNESAELFGEAR
jgi:hypothetical protein